MVKFGKSNSNLDYLFRQKGTESTVNIFADFSDEFPDSPDVNVFHLKSEVDSEYQDIIDYLVESRYPKSLTGEEKEVFQQKVAHYTLIKGVIFKIGADEKIRRSLKKADRKKVIEDLHSGSLGGHFALVSTVNRIRSARYW